MSHPVSPPPAILSGCSNPGARLEICTASPFNAGQFANWCKNSEGVCDVGQSVSLSDDGNIEKAPSIHALYIHLLMQENLLIGVKCLMRVSVV